MGRGESSREKGVEGIAGNLGLSPTAASPREASSTAASYGLISFDARLFGSRHGDCGRTVDGHNRISCYSRPADKHAANVSDGVKANRTGGYDKCNNEADTHDRSMVAARSAAAFGQRDGFKNKGRRLYPPKAAYRECEFAKTISAYAGAARAHETLG